MTDIGARRVVRAVVVLAIAVVCSAHVGTFDVFYSGKAGPYDVHITVRPPGVIPGLAQITVRVAGERVRRVTTQAAQWNLGTRGAPAPDEAQPVDGAPGLYASQLWLMTSASYAINVAVEGERGTGRTVIPVTAVATRRLSMVPGLGWALAAMGVFLTVGALTIVRSAAAESTLAPGEEPDRRSVRRGRSAAAVTAVVLAALLFGGWTWWSSVDGGYERRIFRPLQTVGTVREADGARVLRLTIVDDRWSRRELSPLVPDHGKLVHLFLVDASGMGALAHLHPTLVDSATFDAPIGALPPGRYRYYADVVHESGFAQTLTGETEVPAPAARDQLTDADDTIWRGDAAGSDSASLGDGVALAWDRPETLTAGADALLAFSVKSRDGSRVELEPYLGMPGHALVSRDDGTVFVHLHAGGSFAMASRNVLEAIQRGDTLPSVRPGASPRAVVAGHDATPDHTPRWRGDSLVFPFAFPTPGRYRLWIQVKHQGTVRTAAFDAVVSPGAAE